MFAVVIIVMTYFEMIFTGDILKVALQNTDFVSKVSKKKKKTYGPLENSGERSRAILALLFSVWTRLKFSRQVKSNAYDLYTCSLVL